MLAESYAEVLLTTVHYGPSALREPRLALRPKKHV